MEMVRIENTRNQTFITWHLGNPCPYACSYCPPAYHDGTKRQDKENVFASAVIISDHYTKMGRQPEFILTGGEPTVVPYFPELVDHLVGLGAKASVISNGSRTPRFWDTVLPHLSSVGLTYHVEEADPDKFYEVAGHIFDTGMPLRVFVTMHPDHFDRCVEMVGRCLRSGIKTVAKPLLVNFRKKLYDYTEEQKEVMKQLYREQHIIHYPKTGNTYGWFEDGSKTMVDPEILLLTGQTNFKGWRCRAGLDNLVVKHNGLVIRAECHQGGLLGRVSDPTSIKLPTDLITCKRDVCDCFVDITVSKWRPDHQPAQADPEPSE